MPRIVALTGNEAAAEAMRQIEPDVLAAYPITPQTEAVMKFAQFVADGIVKTEAIPVESEHSAISAAFGAASAGVRVMTATSSQGLALMWEILYIVAATRLPVVMMVANRTLSAPINIHCDHSDTMGARDTGWLQFYCENNQEIYDLMLLAIKVCEDHDVLLPGMVCQDGFITSHSVEGVKILDDQVVKQFIGQLKLHFSLLDVDNPITVGPLDLQDYFFEHKRQEAEAMKVAYEKLPQYFEAFSKICGKRYDFLDLYKMDDAEIAILALSSTCGTARVAVDVLRENGVKAGLIKMQVFRPFPAKEIVDAAKNLRALAVLDRAEGLSTQGGPLFADVCAALYQSERKLPVVNYIYGLGGRDINVDQIKNVFSDLQKVTETGKLEQLVNYIGVRD